MTEFYVQIEDSSGNKLGSGPLSSVTRWQYTARFDRAGSIDFPFAATDPQASIVQPRRIARAYALLNDVWTEVGAGVIDDIETIPQRDGRVSLNVSGMDLIRELSYRTVGTLEIGAGSGATHSAALTAISALAPAGWSFTPAVAPDNDYIYARYGGESVLGALVHLAERTQTHFYRSSGRTLVFTSSFTSSGVRAIQATGDLAAETCAIVNLRRTVDTHDLLTRITPYGSGQGEARLTLAATSRAAPVGYTLSAANNYIENDSATSTYGLVNFPQVEFKEIGPISNTDADVQAAANMLFDAALEELRRRSTLASQETYTLTIAGCSQLLRPMQTIRLVYRDSDQGIDIDDDLYILEATWQVDESGVRTTNLVVSTNDRWPVSDVVAAAERAVEGRVFQAHPQLNANSYVTAYAKNVDVDEVAEFRFRFGTEVVNLQQVLFEFQILPLESTVRSVGANTPTSSSAGSQTPTSSSGGSTNTSSGAGGGATASSSSGGSSTPSSSSGGGSSVSSDSGGSQTPTSSSGGSSTPTTAAGAATGMTQSGIGGTTWSGTTQTELGTTDAFTGADYSNTENANPTTPHLHAFNVNTHYHTIDPADVIHVHTLVIDNHTHTVSISAHTHTVSISAHTHTVTISAHTHSVTISSHTHSTTLSDHTHTVSISAHTHTVSIAAHTHTLSPVLTMQYGLFRETSVNTLTLAELEYQVNGGGWLAVDDDAVDAGDGWYQLDITSLVMNPTTFRPVQANNLIEIRGINADAGWTFSNVTYNGINGAFADVNESVAALSVGDRIKVSGTVGFDGVYSLTEVLTSPDDYVEFDFSGDTFLDEYVGGFNRYKTATIDAQLSVRNTIQAIAYV